MFIKVNICYLNNENLSFNKYDVLSFILFVYTYTLGLYIHIYIYIYIHNIIYNIYIHIYIYIHNIIYNIYIYMIYNRISKQDMKVQSLEIKAKCSVFVIIIITLAGVTDEIFSSTVGPILENLGYIKYHGMQI